jgi:UDP-2,3-diacylglucosamine hydrolase
MPAETAVIVADAHLYHTPGSPSDALFHDFLRIVPTLGHHLILNGDIFDFWFEYKSVIPRQVFPTLALLASLRDHGVSITATGGNHDRWGGAFWSEQLGAQFRPNGCDVSVAGFNAHIRHGDGLIERHVGARIFHWLTRRAVVRGAFHAVHPDLGFWGVRKLSRILGDSTRSEHVITTAAERQKTWALRLLTGRADLQLLVLSHTHRAILVEPEPRRWFLNPGPWMDEHRYAVVTPDGPELRVFGGNSRR